MSKMGKTVTIPEDRYLLLYRESRDCNDARSALREVYDTISRMLTEYETVDENPESSDPDYDAGFALYEDLCNLQGTMAMKGWD